jgi:threonyl-tRNA synthetase
MERFLACLVEHYKAAFPVWLSPIQAIIIPIADRHIPYAQGIEKELKGKGIRVYVDDRRQRMNYKIRQAQREKIPYMIILGDKEQANSTISLRLRDGSKRDNLTLQQFRRMINQDLRAKR